MLNFHLVANSDEVCSALLQPRKDTITRMWLLYTLEYVHVVEECTFMFPHHVGTPAPQAATMPACRVLKYGLAVVCIWLDLMPVESIFQCTALKAPKGLLGL